MRLGTSITTACTVSLLPKASVHDTFNAEHGGNGNVLRDSPADLETQGRDSRPGAWAQGRAPQSLCAANRPPRVARAEQESEKARVLFTVLRVTSA